MVSLKTIAESIEPKWELKQWFQWPPNIFALVSMVLQRTGAYKICLIEGAHWETKNWQTEVEHDSQRWLEAINSGILSENLEFEPDLYKILGEKYEVLKREWEESHSFNKVDLNHLRVLSDQSFVSSTSDKRLREYAIALVSILAIADCCCAGLGMIATGVARNDKDNNLFKTFANLLLTTTGSLSTLPKFHATVLPKMRTPQSGIVLRSLSHHLTFHQTEVEVIWRTFPWLDDNKQSMNLMVVPYPFKVFKTDFKIVQNNYHAVRYFKGKIQENTNIEFLNGLVEHVCKEASKNNEVDMLIFPEMSLSEKQYNYLLNKFSKTYSKFETKDLEHHNGMQHCLKLPIVVAGVLHQATQDEDTPMLTMHNEVRMAVFFCGKWYDITQRKHHRWQLDRNQIIQYGLEGYFSADERWFELCSVMQRRLTILAPNGWMSLTALICEDLARQEPVAEVLRGIGPTLLTALLSDGPQVNTRWSARYASVLADDPGTAVLSLTSKGMALRSQKSDGSLTKPEDPLAVGLWKDMVKGWKVLNLEKDKNALMFTISSKFEKEYTLDGRSDEENSSVFKMDSIKPRQISLKSSTTPIAGENVSENSDIDKMEKSEKFGNWHDIRELSALTFVVDSMVDLLTVNNNDLEIKSISHIILSLFHLLPSNKQLNLVSDIKKNISLSWKTPEKMGTSAIKSDKNSDKIDIELAVSTIGEMVINIRKNLANDTSRGFFEALVDECSKIVLNKEDSNITIKTVATIFLYNANSKLSTCNTAGDLHHGIPGIKEINATMAMLLVKKIKGVLSESIISR